MKLIGEVEVGGTILKRNKVFEVIEAQRIFNIDINKFKHNCIMMDFQMIPIELKRDLNTLFIQII